MVQNSLVCFIKYAVCVQVLALFFLQEQKISSVIFKTVF